MEGGPEMGAIALGTSDVIRNPSEEKEEEEEPLSHLPLSLHLYTQIGEKNKNKLLHL